MKPPSRLLQLSILISGILAVSTASIFIRLAQAQGVPSIVIAAARLAISSLVLAPLALSRHLPEIKGLSRREWILALVSGVFLALHFASWITSLESTTVASSVILVTTTPLWVGLLAPVVLHERIRAMVFVGMLLALLGGAVVGISDSCTLLSGKLACPSMSAFFAGRAFWGDFLALFGAWMAAGYILAGRKLRASISLVPYIFIVYSTAALALLVMMLASQKLPVDIPPIAWLWLVLLALIPQLLGHTTFNWALRYLPASFVSIILLGEPVGSTILAYLVFQEAPGWMKIAGGVLILLGIYLSSENNLPQASAG